MSRYSTDASKVMKLDLGPSHQEQIRKMYTGRREEKRVGPTYPSCSPEQISPSLSQLEIRLSDTLTLCFRPSFHPLKSIL